MAGSFWFSYWNLIRWQLSGGLIVCSGKLLMLMITFGEVPTERS